MSIANNLYALGALMKTNLEEKGVTGLNSNMGLTTLANKILEINTCIESIYFETSNLTKYFHGPKQFIANVYDEQELVTRDDIDYGGNNVGTLLFALNNNYYIRTYSANNNGVKLNINLEQGEYEIITYYKKNNHIFQTTNVITILSRIISEDLIKPYGTSTPFEVTILDENGDISINHQVTFNLNGRFYTRTTDDEGVARLNINLDVGEYIITTTDSTTDEIVSNIITIY